MVDVLFYESNKCSCSWLCFGTLFLNVSFWFDKNRMKFQLKNQIAKMFSAEHSNLC